MEWIKKVVAAIAGFFGFGKAEPPTNLELGKSIGESALREFEYIGRSLEHAKTVLADAKSEAHDKITALQAEIDAHAAHVTEADAAVERFDRVAERLEALLA